MNSGQEKWEIELEDALGAATPEQVLVIMRKIKGWLCWYCITCGAWNNMCGGRRGCDCPNKGE
jgi:hypothetical protein